MASSKLRCHTMYFMPSFTVDDLAPGAVGMETKCVTQLRARRPPLKDLYDHVVPKAAGKWKELGAQLLGDDCLGTLAAIEENCPRDAERCCKRVLEKWLETKNNANWDQLIQALESPSVQLNYLSSQINKSLETKSEGYEIKSMVS